jgi:hypothetical protein
MPVPAAIPASRTRKMSLGQHQQLHPRIIANPPPQQKTPIQKTELKRGRGQFLFGRLNNGTWYCFYSGMVFISEFTLDMALG